MVGTSSRGVRHFSREIGKGNSRVKGIASQNQTLLGDQLKEQRRLASLCFRCGQKYHPGQPCKRQILLLEGDEGSDQEVGEEEDKVM